MLVIYYGFFEDTSTENMNTYATSENMMTSLLGALTGGAVSPGTEASNPEQTINNLVTSTNYSVYNNLRADATDPAYPRVYLNYLVFTEDMALDKNFSQVVQMRGPANTWNAMALPDVMTMPFNGYLLCYFSNECTVAAAINNVYAIHYKGKVLEEQHYYPHGLPIEAGGQLNTSLVNKFLTQGNQMQPELGLQLLDFNARNYDQQIGRFTAVDLLADNDQESLSPYHFCANDPANFIDPSGLTGHKNIAKCGNGRGEKGTRGSLLSRFLNWAGSIGDGWGDWEGEGVQEGDDFSESGSGNSGVITGQSPPSRGSTPPGNSGTGRGNVGVGVSVPPPSVGMQIVGNVKQAWLNQCEDGAKKSLQQIVTYCMPTISMPRKGTDGFYHFDFLDNYLERNPAYRARASKKIGTSSPLLDMVSTSGLIGAVKSAKTLFKAGKAAKSVSVIGPRAMYREFVKKIGAFFLDVTDDEWTMRKNVEFLQGVVERGDDVIFAGKFDPNLLDKTSVLAKEIQYLERHGYRWTKDYAKMILVK